MINFAKMNKQFRILFVILIFCGIGLFAFADRGGFVKKDKPQMNIQSHGTLKNSIPFNLKSGLKYRGSEILNMHRVGNSIVAESVVSYRKGNTVYLVPYKQRIVTPQYSKNDGYKLIIRSK